MNPSSDFLLELLSEEIPARMQARGRNDLARMFAEELDKAGLAAEAIETFATPRRLALIARGLPLTTAAKAEEIKGPRASAPPQALEGFLRKTGLSRDDLVERDGVLFAVVNRPGADTAAVLGPAVARIVHGFPWPKSMRWGAASADQNALRWVRPLQGIVALLGETIVPVEIAGIASSAASVGHRFHHPGPITFGGAHDYVEKLRACHVLVDPDERAAVIRQGARAAAAGAGLALVDDEGLVAENAGLTEWPVPLLGRFDADFLDVPREVIVLTMRTNQKYFACTDDTGALAPAFVCTANIDANDGGAKIIEGNRRVLAARLSDARFFWEQDLKVALEEQAKKLSGIVFHEKLGTVADKVERVAKLARWLAEEGIVTSADPDLADRAARLAKADLVTGMVGEFPELQGVIGGYIAQRHSEPRDVWEAVRDHYKPVGQGDEVPIAAVTVAVSLADKLDSLARFFAAGMPPTGSKDPFALRRSAIGLLSLLLSNNIRCSSARLLEETGAATSYDDLKEFLIDRLKVQQREAGVRHDLIDAVFALGNEDDLVRLLARVTALQAFIETPNGTNLLSAYKRAANILKKDSPSALEGVAGAASAADGEGVPPEEAALTAALDAAQPQATAAIEAEDFRSAMAALASLRAPIDTFFDNVTVNASEPDVRARRLALLARFRDAVHAVADFSKIEG
jgi:glycyl-tRNA synthetase beta chain